MGFYFRERQFPMIARIDPGSERPASSAGTDTGWPKLLDL
jgi:hypothetical protein